MSIDDFKNEEEYVSQMERGMLLNPRVDTTFKAMFTQPTQESREALHAFLEAATERKIKSFSLTANDAPEEFRGQRGVSYDIACEFDDGLAADIEMQAFCQKYDYGKRAEYQVARLETTYLKKGDDWENAPVVYQLTVMDFNYGNDGDVDAKTPVSRYAMRTKDGRELSNALNVIFIELPKICGLEDSLEDNTPLENWAIFLKDADNPCKKDVISRLTSKEAGLMQAQKALSSISENRNFWIAQYRQEMSDRDKRSSINAAIKQGRAEGLEMGKAEGRIQGKMEEKYELARNFLKLGIPIQKIAEGTGLSVSELESLADENKG